MCYIIPAILREHFPILMHSYVAPFSLKARFLENDNIFYGKS